jgi:hypothetical protein
MTEQNENHISFVFSCAARVRDGISARREELQISSRKRTSRNIGLTLGTLTRFAQGKWLSVFVHKFSVQEILRVPKKQSFLFETDSITNINTADTN